MFDDPRDDDNDRPLTLGDSTSWDAAAGGWDADCCRREPGACAPHDTGDDVLGDPDPYLPYLLSR